MISRAHARARKEGPMTAKDPATRASRRPSLNFCWIPNVKSERRLFCSDRARTTQVDSLSKKAGKVVESARN